MPRIDFKSSEQSLFVLISLLIVVLVRLSITIRWPLETLAYDFQFYLSWLKNLPTFPNGYFFTGAWISYGNPLFYITNLFEVEPVFLLKILILLISILCAWSLKYFWNKNYVAGLAAILFFAFSIPQNQAYSMFLFKNIFAIIFMIFGFRFIHEKKWFLFLLSFFIVSISHKTTFVIYLASIFIYFLWLNLSQKRYWLVLITTVCPVVLALFAMKHNFLVNHLIYWGQNENVRDGIFLFGKDFLILTAPYLILAVLGLSRYLKKIEKENPLPILLLIISGAWIIFKMPFYHRILIFLDMVLIIFASYFVSSVNLKRASAKIPLLGLATILISASLYFNYSKEPLKIIGSNYQNLALPQSARQIYSSLQP